MRARVAKTINSERKKSTVLGRIQRALHLLKVGLRADGKVRFRVIGRGNTRGTPPTAGEKRGWTKFALK